VVGDSRRWAWADCLLPTRRRTTLSRLGLLLGLVVPLDRSMRRCSSVLRWRVESTEGVRVVGVCRLGLIRSNRDSRCPLLRGATDGLLGVVEGVVIRIRLCVRVLSGDRVDGVCEGLVILVRVCVRVFGVEGVRGVNTRDRLDERFVDCRPSRVPISRERDRPDDPDREVLGERVVLGVLGVCGVCGVRE